MKKSFRGKIADGGTIQIRLSTNNGLTGYSIAKFQILPVQFGGTASEHTVQIFATENDETGVPRTASANVNFDDPTLLGAATINNNASGHNYPLETIVVFDNLKFNQDIYVTHVDNLGTQTANFYIELEQVKLSKDEATVATLKDMRAGPDTNFGP